MKKTRLYHLEQCVVSNKIYTNPTLGIGLWTIIEAPTLDAAINRFKKLGILFDEKTIECPCCRQSARWSAEYIFESGRTSCGGENISCFKKEGHIYIHFKSGEFVGLHKGFPFSKSAAKTLLGWIHEGKLKLKTSEISELVSLEHNSSYLPKMALDAIKEPKEQPSSKFGQFELLNEALATGILTKDVYDVMKKSDISDEDIKKLKKRINEKKAINAYEKILETTTKRKASRRTLADEAREYRQFPTPPAQWTGGWVDVNTTDRNPL